MSELLTRLREHPDAPRWNHTAGDRLTDEDRADVVAFRDQLAARRGHRDAAPPTAILVRVRGWRERVPWFRQTLKGLDLERDFARLPTTSREDLALRAASLFPDDAPLDRLIVYRTAGTTGHALWVPHHPRAAACYLPLLERALARHGVTIAPSPGRVACFLVGAQRETVTYSCLLTAWGGAGFAKLNLHPAGWRDDEAPWRYLDAFAAPLLTGDPLSFGELLKRPLGYRPAALVSTAVAMSGPLRARLRERLGCPVIDWYSLTETGPIAYACPRGDGYHQLPHDLHLEALNERGAPVPDGERGEITVTGGRNPFLPLLRYRTGDWGRVDRSPCACGDPMPRILALEGRAPVRFRDHAGAALNPVDVARVLRELPIVQHELLQRADGSLALTIRPLDGAGAFEPRLRADLRALFGDLPLELTIDPRLGERIGKARPFASELPASLVEE